MADNNKFNSTVESLFKGMDGFISAKTVVGEPVTINDTIILPLVDVSFGVAAGAGNKENKNTAAGGMGGKMSTSAVLVIHDGITRIVNVNNQDTVGRIIEMVPDLVNKVMKKFGKEDPEVEKAVDEAANQTE